MDDAQQYADDKSKDEPGHIVRDDGRIPGENDSDTQQDNAVDGDDTSDETELLRWSATEYIHRQKGVLWYVVFACVTACLIALALLVMKSVTFAILIPIMAAALIVYSYRPPRVLDYVISDKGVYVHDQLSPYADFKGFAVMHGDDEYSVLLIPVKRFRPGVSIYFIEEMGEEIVDTLAARLPVEEMHIDVVDRLIRALRI